MVRVEYALEDDGNVDAVQKSLFDRVNQIDMSLPEHTARLQQCKVSCSKYHPEFRTDDDMHHFDQQPAIAVLGNLSDGFRFLGPYADFDTAAEAFDGMDVWIASLQKPDDATIISVHGPTTPDPEVVRQLNEQLANAYDAHTIILDDLVHDEFARQASELNNRGPEAQLEFLIHAFGSPDEVAKAVQESAAED